jgi:hypothetical protein
MVNFELGEQAQPNPFETVRKSIIVAEEEDDEMTEDIIPGPTYEASMPFTQMDVSKSRKSLDDSEMVGGGMLASRKDLDMPADEFAEGCKLLQQAALGSKVGMETILAERPHFVNFRDYDRRTGEKLRAWPRPPSSEHLYTYPFNCFW